MSVNILYIEDNQQNYYLVNVLMQTRGYALHWAQDGREGIEQAGRLIPDMILLDIQLPVINGYQVARELRSNPHLSGVPIVALTSYAMAGDREKAIESGCTGYIEKPIDPDTFLAQIDSYLPGSSTAGGGR